ncbi:hypothetical protein PH210_06125 [Paenibacillus sp. BSR1-1]|uniref:hypothetical protein n=1 Tax=Paenibacillus sp. BSR1-1 TaxID=3020845 RepID=UPI0025B17CE0|nr:hypothetical protein [Paenibacillus sp. BSR1-1]MDN3015782.1 hypothetical protein [Paenibacillus sp. BSR1-1]
MLKREANIMIQYDKETIIYTDENWWKIITEALANYYHSEPYRVVDQRDENILYDSSINRKV